MVTVTDLFCGAGGSSSGAVAVPGVRVAMAANHWRLAVDTHQANHPGTDHDCADVSQVDPRRYPRTDVLWASPSCTNHSTAKGRRRAEQQASLFDPPDEAAERSRATMWDVVRFAEHHAYRAVVVENVVDAARWVLWPAWRSALDALGYHARVVYLNSMHAHAAGPPAPQSRDRLYVVCWRRGDRAPEVDRWTRPRAWCPVCDRQVAAVQSWKQPESRWGRYRAQYVYRCPHRACGHRVVEPGWLPAAAAIDWTLPAQRIGDRVRPLAPKTIARIAAGLRRYAGTAAAPLLVPVEGRDQTAARPAAEPMRTQTARNETGLSGSAGMLPFIAALRGSHTQDSPVTAVLPTFAASGTHHGLVGHPPALVMRNNTARGDQGQMSTPVTEPIRTITASGRQSLIRWDQRSSQALHAGDTGQAGGVDAATQTALVGDALIGGVVQVEDCTFRMLEPHEISAGMAFPRGYVVLGTKREKVRQLGNAVTPPAARDLIAAVVEALTGDTPTPTGGGAGRG
jgi:DNA (cytosine-5)-methyltransferase 1